MICLLSDYGTESIYLAELIGVIKSLNPNEEVLPLINSISRQNVFEGAFTLSYVAKEYPAGTIFLAIVDPGVGTERVPLIIVTNKHIFIGPDNGLLSLVSKQEGILGIYEIDLEKLPTKKISSTFHGRDVFAVAAAILSLGFKVDSISKPITQIKQIEFPEPKRLGSSIEGEVVYIDDFGNVITNIKERDLENASFLNRERLRLILKDSKYDLSLKKTYADVQENQPLLLIDSFDLLEIAVNKGNASKYFNLKVGDKVILE